MPRELISRCMILHLLTFESATTFVPELSRRRTSAKNGVRAHTSNWLNFGACSSVDTSGQVERGLRGKQVQVVVRGHLPAQRTLTAVSQESLSTRTTTSTFL